LPPGGSGGPKARTTEILDASLTFGDSSKLWLSGVQDNDAFFPTNWIRSGDFNPDDPTACVEDPATLDWLENCFYGDEVGVDNDKDYAQILGGTVAPHRVVGHETDYMPMAYYNYSAQDVARGNASISFMPSVDIVITSDRSKWTRCPVIELGRDPNLTVGGASGGELRNSPSVDQDGNDDGSGTEGMGWFPGYAIDIESGARLYMAFGENSFLGGDNGADMIWNPTDRLVDGVGNPIMGGMQPVYIWTYQTREINNYLSGFDYPAYIPADANNLATHELYQDFLEIEANNTTTKRNTYSSLGWVAYPMLTPGQDFLSTDAKIRLRVGKEYKNFTATGQNNGNPMYSWSMDDIATVTASDDQLSEALQMINVVPNPYYAYSQYERSRLDTRVKITNLPEVCTVKIFTVNGKLVREFKKDSPVTSLDWDLNNHKAIPVAGGVYLIHVDVPNIGQRVIKFFGGMRQVDLQGI